jgi:LacI family transcriptional regulator
LFFNKNSPRRFSYFMPKLPDRLVTLSQVAAALGVHASTVSKALRRHPRIPEATRERVKAKAAEMGYRPDPVLRSLQAYAVRNRRSSEGATIALIILHESLAKWRGSHAGLSYFAGLERRTTELGFKLEPFCLPQLKREGKDLHRILKARGIRGLLLASPPQPMNCDELPWADYATVALGYSVQDPAVHRAVHHYRFAVKTCIQNLRQLGYRRFALAYAPEDESRLQDGWTSGFRVEQGRTLRGERFFLYRQKFAPGHDNYWKELEVFRPWFDRYRPEVLLSARDWVPSFFTKMKLRVPEDVGLVSLARPPGEVAISGIDQRLDEVGAAAIDLLAAMVHHNEYGLPAVPKTLILEGRWVAGMTVSQRGMVVGRA